MKLQFICDRHRQWLSCDPQRAFNFFYDQLETGFQLIDLDMWKASVPHLGCAFEAAALLFDDRKASQKKTLNQFTYISTLLATALAHLNRNQTADYILTISINRLNAAQKNKLTTMDDLFLTQHIEALQQAKHDLFRKPIALHSA